MRFINNFVAEYKAILTMKNTYKDDSSKVSTILKTLSLTLLMAVIAYFTAILFKTTENLGYLFTMMNGIILGSFIIYKVLLELKIRTSIKGTYKLTNLIIFESLELVNILLLLTTFIMVTLFINQISYFVFITYALLLLVSLTSYASVESEVRKTEIKITSTFRIIQGTVYLYVLFIALGYLVDYEIQTGIVVIYSILSLVYIYKVLFNDMLGYIYKRSIYTILGGLLLIILAYPLLINNSEIEQVNPVTIKKQELAVPDLPSYARKLVTNDERVFLYSDRIEFYDLEYNFLRELDNPGYNAMHYFEEELVVRHDVDTDKEYCKESTFYTVTDTGYEYRGESKTITQSWLYEIDGLYVYLSDYTIYEIDDNCARRDIMFRDEYKDQGILAQTEDYLIFSRNAKESILIDTGEQSYGSRIDRFQRYYYSNGYVLALMDDENSSETEHENKLSIMTAHNFVYNSTNDVDLTLFGVEDFLNVTQFKYTDDYIMLELIFKYGDYDYLYKTVILDHSHNIVHIHEGELSTYVRGFYTEDFVLGEPDDLVFNDATLEFQMISIVTIIVLLFTMMPLPFLKGGVIHD